MDVFLFHSSTGGVGTAFFGRLFTGNSEATIATAG